MGAEQIWGEKHFIRLKQFLEIPSPNITWTKLKVGLLKFWLRRLVPLQVGKYAGSMHTCYNLLFFKFIVVFITVLMTVYSLSFRLLLIAEDQPERNLTFHWEGITWLSPFNLKELFELKAKYFKLFLKISDSQVEYLQFPSPLLTVYWDWC